MTIRKSTHFDDDGDGDTIDSEDDCVGEETDLLVDVGGFHAEAPTILISDCFAKEEKDMDLIRICDEYKDGVNSADYLIKQQ